MKSSALTVSPVSPTIHTELIRTSPVILMVANVLMQRKKIKYSLKSSKIKFGKGTSNKIAIFYLNKISFKYRRLLFFKKNHNTFYIILFLQFLLSPFSETVNLTKNNSFWFFSIPGLLIYVEVS